MVKIFFLNGSNEPLSVSARYFKIFGLSLPEDRVSHRRAWESGTHGIVALMGLWHS